jgi:hypothetical protein
MAAMKTAMHENINSFLPEGYDWSQQEMKLSGIAFTCDDNFVIVLQEFASVSILEFNGLGAFPAELKH